MKIIFLILYLCPAVLLAESFVEIEDSDSQEKCLSCNVEECRPVDNCFAGIVKDSCGCCDVCAKNEFELCDHPEVLHFETGKHGVCGANLECKIRKDLKEGEPIEAICYCEDEEAVCGSDGKTYDNICQMKAFTTVSDSDIYMKFKGPCHSDPVILTPPLNVKNITGSSIALLCEARGFPTPNIEWTWTRVDGKVFSLPSDDLHMSINMRGGPEKWQVTGWLQIIDLMKDHEGDYTCIAQNANSFVKASARVNVIQKKEL